MPILGIIASQMTGHLGLSTDYLVVAGGGGGGGTGNGSGGGYPGAGGGGAGG